MGSTCRSDTSSRASVEASPISLGNAASFTGFNHQGTLNVAANTVTLNSAGYAKLGVLNTLSGGTIDAPNGAAFGSGLREELLSTALGEVKKNGIADC